MVGVSRSSLTPERFDGLIEVERARAGEREAKSWITAISWWAAGPELGDIRPRSGLECRDDARNDGDRILGVLLGLMTGEFGQLRCDIGDNMEESTLLLAAIMVRTRCRLKMWFRAAKMSSGG